MTRKYRRKGKGWHYHPNEHALAGMGLSPRAKGLIDKKEQRKQQLKSFEEMVQQEMKVEDISRDEAERRVKKHREKTWPEEGTVIYEAEEGDILNFQSASYSIKGKWKILDLYKNRQGKKVIKLGKLTQSGDISERANSKKFYKRDIENLVSKWVENEYNYEDKEHDIQKIEFEEEV